MQELAIMLEPRSKEPLYLQIYTFIRGEAEAGRIYQGEKLPSARALAAQLGVSRSTIDMAYAQLVAEGYLEARPNRGYFISSLEMCIRDSSGRGAGKLPAAGSQGRSRLSSSEGAGPGERTW